jgi:hypothetical protein
VSAEFNKPKKKLVDGQKRKMSEPILGMGGSPYHLGFMICCLRTSECLTSVSSSQNQAAFDRHTSIGSIRDAKFTKTLELLWTRLQLAASTEL